MEMIINEGNKYWHQDADGTREAITAKKAWRIFTEWTDAGRTIRRKYGMGGRMTWVWPE